MINAPRAAGLGQKRGELEGGEEVRHSIEPEMKCAWVLGSAVPRLDLLARSCLLTISASVRTLAAVRACCSCCTDGGPRTTLRRTQAAPGRPRRGAEQQQVRGRERPHRRRNRAADADSVASFRRTATRSYTREQPAGHRSDRAGAAAFRRVEAQARPRFPPAAARAQAGIRRTALEERKRL